MFGPNSLNSFKIIFILLIKIIIFYMQVLIIQAKTSSLKEFNIKNRVYLKLAILLASNKQL